MKKRILFSLIAAFVLVAGVALAGEHFKRVVVGEGGGGPHMFFAGEGHFAAELGLSEEQKESVKQLHEELMAKAKPIMEQHHQQMEELHALLDAGNANATEIGQKAIAAHATRKQLEAIHEEGFERFKSLLTEEQQAKLEELKEDHPFPHGGMRMRMHH
jgi:Spy/CpxP family protein refolding chaperone